MRRRAFLPLVTYPDPNADATARNAVATAGLLDASLHALAIAAEIPPVSNALSRVLLDVPEMVREAERRSRRQGERLLDMVVEEAGRAGVDATTDIIAPRATLLADAATLHARYFDIVLCGWEAGNPTSHATAETIIFGAGRPVLLMPELLPAQRFETVAVAWDASRVAARAVADAEIVLRRAERILVLSVPDEKTLPDSDGAARLVRAFEGRGMKAERLDARAGGDPIASVLQDAAIGAGAGLMVMGAYGHSRLREFILGGATRGVLSDLRLPVLLSH